MGKKFYYILNSVILSIFICSCNYQNSNIDKINEFKNDYNIISSNENRLYEEILYNTYLEFKNYLNDSDPNYYSTWYDEYNSYTYHTNFDNHKKYIEFQYGFLDVDNNDRDELIIVHNNNIYDLYTIINNSVVRLFKKERTYYVGDGCDSVCKLTDEKTIIKYTYHNSDLNLKEYRIEKSQLIFEKEWQQDYFEDKSILIDQIKKLNTDDLTIYELINNKCKNYDSLIKSFKKIKIFYNYERT